MLLRSCNHFIATILIREQWQFRFASPQAISLNRRVRPATNDQQLATFFCAKYQDRFYFFD